ncbi:MAG: sulfatase-like hydrolase/transferase, partial [Candidatus Sumerlaeota bacterium]
MKSDKPNILFLIAEDTGCHQGCYGDPVARTPAIDSLAADGCLYEQCIATAPVCAPSRCSYVTGHYAFSLGTHNMRSWTFAQPETFMEVLRENGYYVNWANKQDFNFTPKDTYADEESPWFDDLATGNLPDKPWMLYYNFDITHESFMWPSKWERGIVPELPEDARTDPADVPVPEYIADRITSR